MKIKISNKPKTKTKTKTKANKMSLTNKTIKCGKPNQGKEITFVIFEEINDGGKLKLVKVIMCECAHPVSEIVDRFNEIYKNTVLMANSMNDLKSQLFDILEIPKSQVGNKLSHTGYWEDSMRFDGKTIRSMNSKKEKKIKKGDGLFFLEIEEIEEKEEKEIEKIPIYEIPRKMCSETCCAVKTRRLCESCNKNNVCKKHGTCSVCKGIDLVVKTTTDVLPIVLTAEQERLERNRERARNAYRQRQGIPFDAPLIQRGGARNVKYHTAEQKEQRHQLDREYQKEYQKRYREQKMKDAEMEIENEKVKSFNQKTTSLVYMMSFLLENLKNQKQGKSYSDVE